MRSVDDNTRMVEGSGLGLVADPALRCSSYGASSATGYVSARKTMSVRALS